MERKRLSDRMVRAADGGWPLFVGFKIQLPIFEVTCTFVDGTLENVVVLLREGG